MWTFLHPVYDLYRRYFGSYTLDDPRSIQKSAPYTYFLPSSARLASVEPGDTVQLIFRSHPHGLTYDAERMWVEITSHNGNRLDAKLLNNPFDMPQLKAGRIVTFDRFHMIAIRSERPWPSEPEQRDYWDRCMVDKCVLDDGVPVYYLYREESDLAQPEDKYPDSGWRIRGDYRDVPDEEFEARKVSYVALGAVLNADDSWLHLIDAPVGSAFMRNFDTGEYEDHD